MSFTAYIIFHLIWFARLCVSFSTLSSVHRLSVDATAFPVEQALISIKVYCLLVASAFMCSFIWLPPLHHNHLFDCPHPDTFAVDGVTQSLCLGYWCSRQYTLPLWYNNYSCYLPLSYSLAWAFYASFSVSVPSFFHRLSLVWQLTVYQSTAGDSWPSLGALPRAIVVLWRLQCRLCTFTASYATLNGQHI